MATRLPGERGPRDGRSEVCRSAGFERGASPGFSCERAGLGGMGFSSRTGAGRCRGGFAALLRCSASAWRAARFFAMRSALRAARAARFPPLCLLFLPCFEPLEERAALSDAEGAEAGEDGGSWVATGLDGAAFGATGSGGSFATEGADGGAFAAAGEDGGRGGVYARGAAGGRGDSAPATRVVDGAGAGVPGGFTAGGRGTSVTLCAVTALRREAR